MRVAIMGSGGVGGYYGARLLQAGNDVSFIARGAHGAALRATGLRLRSDQQPAQLFPVKVFSDPKEIGVVDVVLLAVKLWDTAAAADAILPMVGDSTVVASLQNGIDKDDLVASRVGSGRVLGGITYINAAITEPGTIEQLGTLQRVVLGELDGSRSPRCEALVATLVAAGVKAELSTDIRRATWEKFIFLTAYSGVTALTRAPIGAVRAHPATRELLEGCMQEAVAVARASGITIAEGFVASQLAFIDELPSLATSSMAKDLARGNRLELEWLSGAVVRWAESFSLAVPLHRAILAGLILHVFGPLPRVP